MSWKVLGLVAGKTLGSAARKLVLLSMADKANDDGGGVWASMATIAAWADVSRDTAKRIVREFLDEGLIVQVGTRPCTNGVTVIYDLVLSRIEALSDAVKPDQTKSTPRKMHRVQVAPGAESTGCTVNPHPVQDAPPPGAPCTTNLSLNQSMNQNPPKPPASGGNEGDEKQGGEEKKPAKGKKRSETPPAYTEDFEKAWKWWPRPGRARSNKAQAFEEWKTAVRVYTLDGVRAAFRAYAKEAQREGGKYTKALERWLRVNGPISTWIEEAGFVVPEAGRIEPKGASSGGAPTWDVARRLWVYPDGRTERDERTDRNVIT